MKTSGFEPAAPVTPMGGGKDRVKIIVKPGHWTPRTQEGKLFHLLTASSSPSPTPSALPTVKIEVRRAPKLSPTLPLSRPATSPYSSRSWRFSKDDVRRPSSHRHHDSPLSSPLPATPTPVIRSPPSSFRQHPRPHPHRPTSPEPVVLVEPAVATADPMMSGGSVFGEWGAEGEDGYYCSGYSPYNKRTLPLSHPNHPHHPDRDEDLEEFGVRGCRMMNSFRVEEEEKGGEDGGVGRSGVGGDYDALDMPVVGDLDMLETVLTSTAACHHHHAGSGGLEQDHSLDPWKICNLS
ncbi:hypothetical protein ACOMHN_040020 [Nucella lapillus]